MTDSTPSARFGELPSLKLPSFLEFLKLKNFPLKTFPAVYEPFRPKKDTLYLYGPGIRKNQASFDVECLIVQMYLKFCGIEFDVDYINEPASSPSGKLPFLATVSGAIYDSKEIIQWVKETREMAKEVELEQSKAFIALTENKLKAALLFSMWLEPLNAKETTFPLYYDRIPKPVDMIVSYKKQNEIINNLLTDRDILVREEIYQDADKTLQALSVKLGSDKYFFGSSEPTYVDAVIFSYLHCILSMPKIINGEYTEEERKQAVTLSQLARKYDNLVKYSKHIFESWLK